MPLDRWVRHNLACSDGVGVDVRRQEEREEGCAEGCAGVCYACDSVCDSKTP